MMRPSSRTSPPSTLPAAHSLQNRRLIERNDTIDLTIRVLMILAPVFSLIIHIHRRDTEKLCFW
jgi:hypothetical protein